MILALAGGVGGAKLAAGLQAALDSPQDLLTVVNTGDDFEHLGLSICPDLDTVMYTLSGRANPETGWGLAGESWNFLEALGALGGEDWFRLGDRDLATHVERTQRLRAGESLSAVTADLAARLGVRSRIAPMSDDPIRTVVETPDGDLPFQEYFVRRRCEPAVRGLRFEGAPAARMSAAVRGRPHRPCPRSGGGLPFEPLPQRGPDPRRPPRTGGPRRMRRPGGRGIAYRRGPRNQGSGRKIMEELGVEVSAAAVARRYRDLLDGFVLDETDRALAGAIESEGTGGLGVRVEQTVMRTDEDRRRLAARVAGFARLLRGG